MNTCPWDSFEPAAMHFCERELCAWIEQPANTWSNLTYVIVGLVLIALAFREGKRWLAVIGLIEIPLGLGSMVFHASSTHFGEVIDVGMMYLFSCYVLVFNFKRWLAKRHERSLRGGTLMSGAQATALYLLLSGGSIAAVALFRGEIGIWIFAIQAWLAGDFETRIYRHYRDPISYRPLVGLVLTFAVAWGVWWLDLLEIACNPDNHFLQGHAVWHVLNAFCFVFLYRFYAQLGGPKTEP